MPETERDYTDPPGTFAAERVVAGLYGACLTLIAMALLGIVSWQLGTIAALFGIITWIRER